MGIVNAQGMPAPPWPALSRSLFIPTSIAQQIERRHTAAAEQSMHPSPPPPSSLIVLLLLPRLTSLDY